MRSWGRAGAPGFEDSWFGVREGWLMARKENPGSPWFLRDENRRKQANDSGPGRGTTARTMKMRFESRWWCTQVPPGWAARMTSSSRR